MLSYLDIMLIAATNSTAILFATILSICLLGEKLVCKYDLPGVLLICGGAAATVIQMNTKVDLKYDRAKIKACIFSFSSLLVAISTVVITITMIILCLKLNQRVKECRKDIEKWLE